MTQFSTLCECWAPKRSPPPLAVCSTSGSETWPPVMKRAFVNLVDDHVPGHREEVGEHQLGDRAQAGHGGAHRGAHDGLLADGRIADPLRAERVEEPLGELEDAARHSDVLLDQEDVRVAPHLLGDASGEDRTIGEFRHAVPPSDQTSVASSSGLGSGLARALASAAATSSRARLRSSPASAPVTPSACRRCPLAGDWVLGQPLGHLRLGRYLPGSAREWPPWRYVMASIRSGLRRRRPDGSPVGLRLDRLTSVPSTMTTGRP